jgi:hypothetical protein
MMMIMTIIIIIIIIINHWLYNPLLGPGLFLSSVIIFVLSVGCCRPDLRLADLSSYSLSSSSLLMLSLVVAAAGCILLSQPLPFLQIYGMGARRTVIRVLGTGTT